MNFSKSPPEASWIVIPPSLTQEALPYIQAQLKQNKKNTELDQSLRSDCVPAQL